MATRLFTGGRGVVFLLLLLGGACASPCKDLSETICRCEPTEPLQQACIRRVEAEEDNREVTEAQQQACQDVLNAETCTCRRLEAGDLEACGLTVNTQ